jgi:DNA-binding transcriptional regulator GbsR (MarR family)
MDIDELISWVMKVDRRFIVMKTIYQNDVIKASDIATKTGRSLQNISYAIRELEKHGLVRCITPKKSTWKRFIFTDEGMKVFKKLRKSEIQKL